MPKKKYDTINKYAVAHLQDCLKLQNNTACLNVIIDNILEVGKRHFHPVILASHRKEAKIAIGKELKKLYPDIFAAEDSEKRIYIAVQIAMRHHSLQKQDSPKKKNKAGQSPLQETPASKSVSKKPYSRHSLLAPDFWRSPSQDQNQGITMRTRDEAFERMEAKRVPDTQRSPLIPTCNRDEGQVPINITTHALDRVSSKRNAEMPLSERMSLNLASVANAPSASMFASPVLRVRASHSSGSVTTSFSQHRRRVLFVPHLAKSQPQLNKAFQPRSSMDDRCSEHSSVSTMSATYSTSAISSDQNKSVHHFLEASVPSMGYLLPHFIDYGCTHEVFLLAVSVWPPERISKFLEDVVTGPHGLLISPMEKMVLENHFRQYFKLNA